MDMLTDLGDRLAKTDPVRAAAAYRQGLTIAGQNNYLFYSQQMARKLFDFYTARGDNLAAAAYSRQLVNLHDEQDKLSSSSGIDYLDYALKDEQVRLLTIRSGYETYLLAVSLVAFLLAVAVLIVIRRNLKRTTNQNHQMQIALDALEQSQADNARMMKIAAHDLRNPIGAMHSLAGLMLSETDRPASDRKMLEMIRTSGENSLELVSDLLEVQFRTEELNMEPVDIAQIVGYCVSLLKNKAEAKGQYIQLEVIPVTLRVSREKMWRVVSNLIANAIKFSPAGAVIRVSMQQQPQSIRILVKDDGIGIPPEMKDKVFDMFTEAKRTGTDGEQPFGLGLAISKQIVEAHGGRIWFESEPGKGTTFFVELPLS
jgi:signal transduction histidine kinase